MFVFLIILILCVLSLVTYKVFMQKEHFSTTCYDEVVIDELVDNINKNNIILDKHGNYVKHFANNYYKADEIDQIMSSDRTDMNYFESSVNGTLNRYRDQMSKFATHEIVDEQFLKKDAFEKSLLPYAKQSDLKNEIEMHSHNVDSMFYRKNLADDTFLKMGDINAFYASVANVDTNIDIYTNTLKSIQNSLQNYETKDNIKGTYVLISDFDKVKDKIHDYKSELNTIQGIIDDSQLLYDASKKTILSRFDAFYRDLDNVRQQQLRIQGFLKNENNKINTEQIFAYQQDFAILQGDVDVIEESTKYIDGRVDDVEKKLINMGKEICVGGECLQYADMKDMKSMVNLFRSTYEQEKELLENMQVDMASYKNEMALLQQKLTTEISIREDMMKSHAADLEQLRTKMSNDNDSLSASYQSMINRLMKEKSEFEESTKSYINQSTETINDRNAKVNEMQEVIDKMEDQLKRLNGEKETISKRLNELVRAYEDENGGYYVRMQEKNEMIKKLQKSIDNASSLISQNDLALEQVKLDLQSMTNNYNTCKSDLSENTTKLTNAKDDVERISILLQNAQAGNGTLQEELTSCNIEKANRFTKQAYDLVQQDLLQCNKEKNNDYIPRLLIESSYMLINDHETKLGNCELDKKNNYLHLNLVNKEYVPVDKYLLLRKEIDDPKKYMTTQYVMNNYKSNAQYQDIASKYATECVSVNLINTEKEKTQNCETDKNDNYTPNSIVQNEYINKTKYMADLEARDEKCKLDKIQNYTHNSLYDKALTSYNTCESDKNTKYVGIDLYNSVQQDLQYCNDDKKNNYYSATVVKNNYTPNIKVNEAIALATKNMVPVTYVDQYYIKKSDCQNEINKLQEQIKINAKIQGMT